MSQRALLLLPDLWPHLQLGVGSSLWDGPIFAPPPLQNKLKVQQNIYSSRGLKWTRSVFLFFFSFRSSSWNTDTMMPTRGSFWHHQLTFFLVNHGYQLLTCERVNIPNVYLTYLFKVFKNTRTVSEQEFEENKPGFWACSRNQQLLQPDGLLLPFESHDKHNGSLCRVFSVSKSCDLWKKTG